MSASRPRKRGGSQARRRSSAERRDPMLGYLSRNLPIVEPLDQQQIEHIDHESMRILEEVGVVFRDPIALEDWRKAGVRVDGERVYFDRGHIRELISSIPATITLHARDQGHSSNSGKRKARKRSRNVRWNTPKNCYETTKNPNWTRPKTRNCWTTSPGANGKSRRIKA